MGHSIKKNIRTLLLRKYIIRTRMYSNATLCQTLSNRVRTFEDLRFWGPPRVRGSFYVSIFFNIIKTLLHTNGTFSKNLKAIGKEFLDFLEFGGP